MRVNELIDPVTHHQWRMEVVSAIFQEEEDALIASIPLPRFDMEDRWDLAPHEQRGLYC